MATIIMGFSKSKSPYKIGSLLIRLSEKRNFSHAYINYQTEGIEVVAQASHGYVNQISYTKFLEDNIVVEEYTIECSEPDLQKIKEFVIYNLGAKYSRLQIILIAIKKLLHIQIKENNKDTEFICSEFALRILDVLGFPDQVVNKDYETPSDLQALVSSLAVLMPNKVVRTQI